MSRMHAPETNRLAENHNGGGTPNATCPVCQERMNPGRLPTHIATEHGGSEDE